MNTWFTYKIKKVQGVIHFESIGAKTNWMQMLFPKMRRPYAGR